MKDIAPIVSIVTPTFNSENYIGRAVESVRSQTFGDWELLVVDDCSCDSTVDIVKRYMASDERIRLLNLDENGGAAVARNLAIDCAKGRYICFLDSDDQWLPHKLESQLRYIEKTNASLVFSAYQKIDDQGRSLGVVGVPHQVSYTDLLKTCHIGCLTAMYDAKKLGKVKMPLIRKRQDLGLWLKILRSNKVAYGQHEVLAVYTVRDDSISANKCNASIYQWKLYRDVEHLGIFKSAYYFVQYAIRGTLRNKCPRISRFIGFMST